MSIKAIHDTMRPNGLVPPLLVISTQRNYHDSQPSDRNQLERSEELRLSRTYRETIVADLRTQRSLRKKLPQSTTYLINRANFARL